MKNQTDFVNMIRPLFPLIANGALYLAVVTAMSILTAIDGPSSAGWMFIFVLCSTPVIFIVSVWGVVSALRLGSH